MILTEARTNISAGTYLARPAERLVLEGYRGWTWTLARASREPLTRTCRLYRSELGEHAGPVLEALKGFALALGLGTTRSLNKGDLLMVPENTPHWFSPADGGVLVLMSLHLPIVK